MAVRTIIAVATIALLAACQSAPAEGPSPSPSSSATAESATASPATAGSPSSSAAPKPAATGLLPDEVGNAGAQAFPTSTALQNGPADSTDVDGPTLRLVDVRAASQPGYTRVVLEFDGEGVPGWSAARYVGNTTKLEMTDETVTVRGDAVLGIVTNYVAYDASNPFEGRHRLHPNLDRVTEIFVAGTTDGDREVLVGLHGKAAPFRLFTLANPARVVVDIRD